MKKTVDTTNKHLVSCLGDDVVILNPPVGRHARMSRVEALTFAAWIVALAGDGDGPTFAEILDAVGNT